MERALSFLGLFCDRFVFERVLESDPDPLESWILCAKASSRREFHTAPKLGGYLDPQTTHKAVHLARLKQLISKGILRVQPSVGWTRSASTLRGPPFNREETWARFGSTSQRAFQPYPKRNRPRETKQE